MVTLEFEQDNTRDSYGRLLAYVEVDGESIQGTPLKEGNVFRFSDNALLAKGRRFCTVKCENLLPFFARGLNPKTSLILILPGIDNRLSIII
jgi:hypothetical protein